MLYVHVQNGKILTMFNVWFQTKYIKFMCYYVTYNMSMFRISLDFFKPFKMPVLLLRYEKEKCVPL